MSIEGKLMDERKHFFLKKEAKTFVHWRARCGNAHAI
jgi:hypothetical protein